MVRLLSILLVVSVSISNGNALRGRRHLQDVPTTSPTSLTETASAAGLETSEGTLDVDATDPPVDTFAEEGTETSATVDGSGSTNAPEQEAQGDVSWFGEESIVATTTPAADRTDSAFEEGDPAGRTTDAPLDSTSEGELEEAAILPGEETPTTSPTGVIAESATMSAATDSSLEGEPTVVTDPTEPTEEGSELDAGANNTTAVSLDESTTAATQNAETTTSAETTEAGVDGDLTQSSETTSATAGSATPYDGVWSAPNVTNSTGDENYTGMDDEGQVGDDYVGDESYWEGDDETPADDEADSFYEEDDFGGDESWSPWDEKNDGPTYQPTPRPTHEAYVPSTDDILEETSTTAAEFDDDLKNTEAKIEKAEEKVKAYLDGVESPTEMESDKNVQVVAGVLTTVFLALWLLTAHQTMENPDGLCASFCRLTLKFFGCLARVLFLPCRYMCCKDSQQSMGRRSHAPMRAPFPSDLELS